MHPLNDELKYNSYEIPSTGPKSAAVSDKAKKMAEVLTKYLAFVQEISFSGKKNKYGNPPEEIIASNCKRIFNKQLCQESRDKFVSLLEGFYAANGPWVIKIKNKEFDLENNNVELKLSVNIGAVSNSETVRLHFNENCQIDEIDAVLKPKRGEPTLEVGIDEYLQSPGPKFEPTGFKEFFNLNSEQEVAFYQAALKYYKERFGIDPDDHFVIFPVTFGENYRVLNSHSKLIPAEVNGIATRVQIAEYVLVFNDKAAGKFYGGSYSPDGKKPINPTHNISFGKYRLVFGDGRHYDITMQSKVPNSSISTEGHVLVKLALQSEEFGKGEGAFVANMKFTPNAEGRFKTFVKGNWHFPGLKEG